MLGLLLALLFFLFFCSSDFIAYCFSSYTEILLEMVLAEMGALPSKEDGLSIEEGDAREEGNAIDEGDAREDGEAMREGIPRNSGLLAEE